jgi:hypothetical protein
MKRISLIIALLLLPAVAFAAEFQVKWSLNWTENGLPAPAWTSPVYADIDNDGIQELIYNPG